MTVQKTILVAGGTGQVARSLTAVPAQEGIQVIAAGRPHLDLLEEASIRAALDKYAPDIIVNAAAYTAVDQAESDAEAAFALNAVAPGKLAAIAAERSVPIIHLSTDYVFDGTQAEPYVESDPVAPLGVYGRSKLAGEQAVAAANPAQIILRTAWVYSPFGKNFVKTMLRVADGRDELGVVHDQRGNPTSARDIARAILDVSGQILAAPADIKSGIYHMSASGAATWAEFAEFIFATSAVLGGPTARINRITSAEYPTPVARPANSRLDCRKFSSAYGISMPDWQDSTRACVETLILSGEWKS